MNRGAALLERKRAELDLTFRQLGAELGCSVATAHRLCTGTSACADRRLALSVYRFAGVPLTAWDDRA